MERFTRPDQNPWLVTVMSCSCHWTYWTTHGSSRLHLCTGPVVQHLFFLVAEVDVWGSCYLSEFSPGVQDGPPGYGHKKIWGKDWYTIGVLGFQIWHGSLFWYIYIYTHIYMYIYIHIYINIYIYNYTYIYIYIIYMCIYIYILLCVCVFHHPERGDTAGLTILKRQFCAPRGYILQ